MREITFAYTHADQMGYGRMGLELHRSLSRAGVDVYDLSPAPLDGPKTTNVAVWASYPTHVRGWMDGQYTAIFTMFETTALPEAFRATLPNFDQVLVPSEQNRELFAKFHRNVACVPLGIDPERWHYVPRQEPVNEFRFMVGGSGERKGGDLAHAAFRKVFGSRRLDPAPVLVVKSPKPADFYGENVRVVTGFLSSEEEVALYASAHCYLQPSRGEGFGLQPLQAIAQGCPTILTGAHGHAGFAHLGTPISSRLVPSGYFSIAGRGGTGEWWEPSLDELCEAMEAVYADYPAATEKARASAATVAETFTWDHSAARLIEAIGPDRLTVPYAGAGQWIEPQEDRFLTRVLRDYGAEIAGASFQWEAGRDYYETADIKRVLLEADVLDPSCLDYESMGIPAEKAEAYSARHAYCYACHQKLGTGLTKADEIFAQLESEASR